MKILRLAFAAGGGALVASLSTGAGQMQPTRDYGFVLSSMGAQFYVGDDKIDCPEGRSPSTQAAFLESVTAPERARLLKPENAPELERRYKEDYVYGPNGTNICTDAELFDTPDRILQKPVQSKIGPGMDLDGAIGAAGPAPDICPHDSFTSPTGEKGVDNQYFRSIACNTSWRGVGGGQGDFLGELSWADSPVVVVVRGVESWSNDPEVEVVIAASPDRAPRDATQKVIEGGSLGMTQNPRHRVKVRGEIRNGVLTTEPADLILPRHWVGASGGEFVLNKARIRARLNDKGELEGDAGGYRPIDNAIAVLRVGGPGVASAAGVECASVRKTMRLLADGDRDPKTGQCTSISQGLDFAAKPAFVFDQGRLAGAPGAAITSAAALKP
ncbi:hypothetical protein LJR219_004349 [Phenylobacterium sp. LjRoot219]|uniref:hypothetical protein n=1 Tax=Phenylobacterium sp. LjRoot219 TaxID=3342283 RepID=UPI003ED008F6